MLACLPIAGADDDEQPIGYVKVIAAGLGATVGHGRSVSRFAICRLRPSWSPACVAGSNTSIWKRRRCRSLSTRDRPAEPQSDGAKPLFMPADEARQFGAELHKLDGESEQYTRRRRSPPEADWLVCRIAERPDELFLMPRSGMARSKGSARRAPPPLFGPIPPGKLAAWLSERLARIARAQTLLRIVGSADSLPDAGGESLDVRLVRLKDKNTPGEPLGDLVLHPGDRIGLRIKNQDREPVDVTVLFIDSGFGISTFFPSAAGIDNRLKSTDPVLELRAKITGDHGRHGARAGDRHAAAAEYPADRFLVSVASRRSSEPDRLRAAAARSTRPWANCSSTRCFKPARPAAWPATTCKEPT